MITDEKLYHDVMFSIGCGAGERFDIDVTSEFSLLPDAAIHSESVINCLDDFGHATNAHTPRPHAVEKLSSSQASADENFYDHNMGSIDPPDGPMPTAPPGRPPVPGILPQQAQRSKKVPTKSKGVAGRVPVLDLLRIWDTGASQGMVDKAVVSSKNSFVGGEITCVPETVQ